MSNKSKFLRTKINTQRNKGVTESSGRKLTKSELIRNYTSAIEMLENWTKVCILVASELYLLEPENNLFKENLFKEKTLALIKQQSIIQKEKRDKSVKGGLEEVRDAKRDT